MLLYFTLLFCTRLTICFTSGAPRKLWLANHYDVYFTKDVVIGAIAGKEQTLSLTMDTRAGGMIVAGKDSKLPGFGHRRTFDKNASPSYQATANGPANSTGTDVVYLDAALLNKRMAIDIVMQEVGLDSLFKPFLEQPFDGLLYLGGYAPNYTIYLPKLCVSGLVPGAGFVAYVEEPEKAYCSTKTVYNSLRDTCVLPHVNISQLKFTGPGAPLKQFDNTLQAFVIPIPEIALPQEIFDSFTDDLGLWEDDGVYHIGCSRVKSEDMLRITVGYASYYVEMQYLVDKLEGKCVLRMRPLVPSDDYCSSVCGMPINCNETTVILGLPFLQRYCVYHDVRNGNVALYNLYLSGKHDYTSLSTTVIIVISTVSSFAALLLVCTFIWWWKRRNRRRRRIVVELSKKYGSSRRANQYVPQVAMRRDQWELLSSDVTVEFANKIGSGAFADVYKGRLVADKAYVAVKLAKDALDESRLDLQREIDFMKELGTHARVLNMLGHTVLDDDRLALVLEFCANGDLSNWLISHAHCINRTSSHKDKCELHGDSISIQKQLLSFAWQISDGLLYLASRSLVHRDIAARNVLLTSELTAKISDFGLCRRTEGNVYNTRHGKLPIKWMAPEALRTGTFTAKTDIWSFGVLLYEIYAAGSLPFPHVQPYEQLGVLERGERPEQPEACPDNIYDLMRRCWEAEPDGRPTAVELKQCLEGIIGSKSAAYGYFDFADVPASLSDEAQ